jgi:hypothetical protein
MALAHLYRNAGTDGCIAHRELGNTQVYFLVDTVLLCEVVEVLNKRRLWLKRPLMIYSTSTLLEIFETRPSILATLVHSSISSQPRNVLFS